MSLQLKLGPAIDVGVSLHGLLTDPAFSHFSIEGSPVLGLLGVCWWAISGVNSREFFGYPGGRSNEIVSFHGLKPESVPFDPMQDFSRYSFPLGELVRLSSASQGASSAFDGENQVQHFSLHGEVAPIHNHLYTYHHYVWHGRTLLEVDGYDGAGLNRSYALDDENYPVGFGPSMVLTSNAVGGRFSLRDCLEHIRLAGVAAQSEPLGVGLTGPTGPKVCGDYGGIYGGYSDFSYEILGPHTVSLKWDEWFVHPVYTAAIAKNRISITISCVRSGREPVHSPTGNALFDLKVEGHLKVTGFIFDGLGLSDEVPFHDVFPAWNAEFVINTTYSSPSHFALSNPWTSDGLRVAEFFQDSVTLRGLYSEALEAHRWSRPSINRVLVELTQSIEQRSSNWIEFFAEIDELLTLFPSEQLMLALRGIESESLPARLRAIALAVAGGYLLYSFGWRPLVGTPQAAIDVLQRLADRCDSLNKTATFRASQNFDMDGEQLPVAWMPKRLRTRTRVTVGGFNHPSSKALVSLESMGILPTPSRLWDVTAWSFVIDYFFNLSDRFESLEAFFFLCLMDARDFVHSYTYEFELTESILSGTGLMPLDKAYLQLYVREKSRYVPALFAADTASSFIKERPNWLIIAALVSSILL